LLRIKMINRWEAVTICNPNFDCNHQSSPKKWSEPCKLQPRSGERIKPTAQAVGHALLGLEEAPKGRKKPAPPRTKLVTVEHGCHARPQL